ncbi:MAG TPA: hypothetical protein VN706_01585 [Gemmatimonadaceae bacterium]|nr:hypothetical protein [Gemmatimonadaceae bacterium]
MHVRRLNVVAGGMLVLAIVTAGCSEIRSLAPDPARLAGTWVAASADSTENWKLSVTNDTVSGGGTWDHGPFFWGEVGVSGTVSGNVLQLHVLYSALLFPDIAQDLLINDEGDINATLESPTDLVGTMHDRKGTTRLIHFRKVVPEPLRLPPSGNWSTNSAFNGLGMNLTLAWSKRDSVHGTGTYSATPAMHCGNSTLTAGTVKLTAVRPESRAVVDADIAGTMTLSDTIQFVYHAFLADSTRLVGTITAADPHVFNGIGPCPFVLRAVGSDLSKAGVVGRP